MVSTRNPYASKSRNPKTLNPLKARLKTGGFGWRRLGSEFKAFPYASKSRNPKTLNPLKARLKTGGFGWRRLGSEFKAFECRFAPVWVQEACLEVHSHRQKPQKDPAVNSPLALLKSVAAATPPAPRRSLPRSRR